MPAVTEILRQAREAKGITLDEVAQRTYIKPQYLAALEEGDMTKLPAPVYVHGYIRQYAKLLGLNGTELVLQYQQDASRPQAPAKLLLSPSGRHSNFEPAEVPVPVHAMAGAERGDVSRPIAEPFGSEPSETRVIEPVVGGPTPWEPTEEPRRAPSVELPALSASSAEPRFSGPLSSSSEVHSAKQQAQQIVTLAQREAQEMRIAAERYADQVLAQLETEVSRALQTVRNGRAFLQSKRRKQQENN